VVPRQVKDSNVLRNRIPLRSRKASEDSDATSTAASNQDGLAASSVSSVASREACIVSAAASLGGASTAPSAGSSSCPSGAASGAGSEPPSPAVVFKDTNKERPPAPFRKTPSLTSIPLAAGKKADEDDGLFMPLAKLKAFDDEDGSPTRSPKKWGGC